MNQSINAPRHYHATLVKNHSKIWNDFERRRNVDKSTAIFFKVSIIVRIDKHPN